MQWADGESADATYRNILKILDRSLASESADDAYSYVRAWVKKHAVKKLIETHEYGRLTKNPDGGYCAIIPYATLKTVLADGGFRYKPVLKEWKNRRTILCRGCGYSNGRRVNGKLVECIELELGFLEDAYIAHHFA